MGAQYSRRHVLSCLGGLAVGVALPRPARAQRRSPRLPVEGGIRSWADLAQAVKSLGASGGRIELEATHFYVTDAIRHARSNITITGKGGNATVLWPWGNYTGPAFVIGDGSTYCTGNELSDFTINGNRQMNDLIHLHGTERATLRNVHAVYARDHGIRASGTASRPTIYLSLSNCYLNTNGFSGLYLDRHVYGARVMNNTIAGNGRDRGGAGIWAMAGDNHHVGVNNFDENEIGVYATWISEFSIKGNQFQQQTKSSIVLDQCINGEVEGGTIVNTGMSAPDVHFGIKVENCRGVRISNIGMRSAVNRMSDGVRELGGAGNSIWQITAENALYAVRASGAGTKVNWDTIVHLPAAPKA